MKKQLLAIIFSILFLVPIISATYSDSIMQDEKINGSKTRLTTKILNGGWLEERDGIRILHVNGSNYEMGYQHGFLLREDVQENIRAFLAFAQTSISYEKLLLMWNAAQPYVPDEHVQEMQGIADGANVSFSDIAAAIMAIEWADHGCYGIAAWGPATEDGRLYHARSFDLPSILEDPVSGTYAHENTVLIVRNPENGYASLCPSIAGSFHTGGGINEQGVGIGLQICWSKDQTIQGNPYHFRIQQVLDHAKNATEAVTIMNINRTHGYNLIISDAATPIGFAVEQSANHTYVGTYNNSIESNKPFWALDHIVRRTNIFIDPTISATQRKRYDPTGLLGFLNLLFYQKTGNFFFAVYRLYKSVSDELTANQGSFDLNTTMAALQNGYQAKNDFLLNLIKTLGKGTGMAEAWNQWTACPENGDMVVSFATRDAYAYQNPTHFFNFYNLLHTEPPNQ